MIELLLIFGALCLFNGIIFSGFMYFLCRAGATFDDDSSGDQEKP